MFGNKSMEMPVRLNAVPVTTAVSLGENAEKVAVFCIHSRGITLTTVYALTCYTVIIDTD